MFGYFDYEYDLTATSEEFTPGFDQFAVDNFGGVALRPDSLEYFSLGVENEQETALPSDPSEGTLTGPC